MAPPATPIPTVFLYLYSGSVVSIPYINLNAAAEAMAHFIKVLGHRRKYRTGAYCGAQTTLSAAGAGEVSTVCVEHNSINAARLILVRPPEIEAVPAPSD